jgi:zinc protease
MNDSLLHPSAQKTVTLEALLDEPIERRVLDNGLVAIVKPDHTSAVASIQVWVRTGSIHEGSWSGGGLSHFLEHMLFKGTDRRGGREISALVQSNGGSINAYTTFDRTVYYIDLPSESVDVALDVLGDAVFNSRLPKEEVDRERDVILREIDMYLDDPDHLLSQALFETAFHGHPYRQPIIGHRAVFEKVSRDDLVSYYRARYVPNNAVVIVVGDVDLDEIFISLEKHFGSSPRARLAPVFLPEESGQLAPRSRELSGDVQITRVGLAYQVPGLEHPDTPPLDLLAMILGYGDSSYFWQELRERKRLVHSIGASNWNPGSTGLFYVSMVCEPENRDASIAGVQEVIDRIQTRGVPQAVLAKAIRQVQVGEINVRKTMSGQASRLGIAEVVVGEINFAPTYLRRLAEVTGSDLKRVAGAYLDSGRLTKVVMNPKRESEIETPRLRRIAANPDFEEVRLDNGLRILFRENLSLPNLHVRIVGRAGGFLEPEKSRGITQLMATMLTRDTENRTSAEVARLIESVGGSLSEFSGDNSFGLSCEVLPDDSDLALDLLSDALLRPAFKPATVQRERDAQLAGIREAHDDIVHAAASRLRGLFFGHHPLAVDSDGKLEMVERLRPSDLRSQRDLLVRGGNLVVAVSGAFEREDLLGRITEAFSGVTTGEVQVPVQKQRLPASNGDHVFPKDREQVIVYHGFPGPGILSDDFVNGEVLDEVLSGMASRLFERVREEKGLAYFVRSGRIVAMTEGMFFLVAGTNPSGHEQVISELRGEVDRVREGGVTEEELRRSQVRLKAGRRMSMQTNAACSIQAALNAIYGLPVNDWRYYDAKIDAVKLDDLEKFARVRFTSENRLQLLAGAVTPKVAHS